MAQSPFSGADWVVIAGYFGVLALTGGYFARKGAKDSREYFLGNRKIPVWAIAVSVIATAISAATYTGVPAESYGPGGDLTYLSTNIGALIAIVIVAFSFIPAFYARKVSTVYQILEVDFGPGAKLAASWTFMVGRTVASGARLYVASRGLAMILQGSAEQEGTLVACIAVLALTGIFYTLAGGITSVIWTDVIQTGLFVGAAVATIAFLLNKIPLSAPQIVEALSTGGPEGTSKLTMFRLGLDPGKPWFGFDPSQTFTLLTAVTGFTLMNLAAYGTDQDMAQRMLTCDSAIKGGRSAITAIVVSIPIVFLFAIIGLLLYVYYTPRGGGPSIAGYDPGNPKDVFLSFILREMPGGMRGFLATGLFAAALASVNSQASTLINDWYRPRHPHHDEKHYLRMGRWAVVFWGTVQGLFAVVCVFWHGKSGETLLQFALGVMTFAYAGLLGVFLTAILTKRGNTASAIAAIVVGFFAVLVQQPNIWNQLGTGIPTPAFPWRLTSATILATLVCCAGRRRSAPAMMVA